MSSNGEFNLDEIIATYKESQKRTEALRGGKLTSEKVRKFLTQVYQKNKKLVFEDIELAWMITISRTQQQSIQPKPVNIKCSDHERAIVRA